MSRSNVKILFFPVVLLTALIICSLTTSAQDLYPGMEQELIIQNRDVNNDKIREYESEIEALDAMLLNMRIDEEWLDLKLLHIQNQDRIIPEILVESRQHLIEKKLYVTKQRAKLMELVQKHNLMVKNLDQQIDQLNSIKTNSISVQDLPLSNDTSLNKDYFSPDIEKELKAKIDAMEIQDWVKLIRDNQGLRLEVQLPILFASGKSTANASYDEFLKKIASLAKPYDVHIHVKGFTDELKPRKMSNIELGAKRAAKIVNQLIKYGMSPSIFKITSRGEYQQGSHVDKKSPSLKRRAEVTVYFLSS